MGIFDFLLSKDVRLQKAIDAGVLSKIFKLIESGANINIKTESGKTALEVVIERRNKHYFEILVSKKVNLEIPFKNGNTALLEASANSDETLAKLLIDKGADINASNKEGVTPLLQALKYGKLASETLAELLIDKGADINAGNKEGVTPLLQALRYGNFALAEKLLLKGALVSNKLQGKSIIWLVLSKTDNIGFLKMLIEKGIELDQENDIGYTELMYALNKGSHELIKLFLENGVCVNYYSKNAFITPLLIAIRKNDIDAIRLLISKGADVNFGSTINGLDALSYTLKFEQFDIAELLLENGADVKKAGDLISKANFEVKPEIVNFLRKNGVKINEPIKKHPIPGKSNVSKINESIKINDLGNVYYNQGNFERALSCYNQAIELDKHNSIAYTNRANLFADFARKDGKYYKLAINDYSKALIIDPENFEILYNRGVTHKENNQFQNN